jgi:hypothetical protein
MGLARPNVEQEPRSAPDPIRKFVAYGIQRTVHFTGKNEELREFYSKPATFPSRALKAREGHGSEPAVERAD